MDEVQKQEHDEKRKKIVRAFEDEYSYYVLTRINRKPSITNSRQPFFPQRYSHPGIDVVTHPKTGNKCTIRYVLGEASIYKEDQSRDVTDRSCSPIIFEEGLCQVGIHETNLKEFLDLEGEVNQLLAEQKSAITDHCRKLYQGWPQEAQAVAREERELEIYNLYQETLSEVRKQIYNEYIGNRSQPKK